MQFYLRDHVKRERLHRDTGRGAKASLLTIASVGTLFAGPWKKKEDAKRRRVEKRGGVEVR